MPRPSNRDLARLSRDRSFLVRISTSITAASVVLAWGFSFLPTPIFSPLVLEKKIGEMIQRESDATSPVPDGSVADWIDGIRFGRPAKDRGMPRDCTGILFPGNETTSGPDGDELQDADPDGHLLSAVETFREALSSGRLAPAISRLESLPATLPYRNELLGDLRFLAENYAAAVESYREEVENRPGESAYAARSAVMAARRGLERDTLTVLLRDPEFSRSFSPGEKLALHTDARDFRGMAVATLRFELASLLRTSVIPSFGIALIWFLILMPFWEATRPRVVAALAAFLLGVLSASLTLFFVILQERVQGFDFDPGATPVAQFLYFVAGVGLREETLKLVCCLPVAIWAVRRRSDIEGMMLAAMVGLGFAFKENILYLEEGLTSYLGWVRFLTANALHFSLTGVAGFHLYRMLRRKGNGWEEFLASFILVVLAHGIYNSVLAMPALASYAPLSPILIAIIAYRFFDPLRSTMDTVGIGHRISPLGVFVLGSVILTCLVLLTSSMALPYRFALGAFLAGVGGMIPLSFAFISRFRDL